MLPPELHPPEAPLVVLTRQRAHRGFIAYATEEAIGLDPTTAEDLKGLAGFLPREGALLATSFVMAHVWQLPVKQTAHLELAVGLFGPGETVKKLKRFLDDEPDRVIFSEQAFFALLAQLLLHAKDSDRREMSQVELEALRVAFLGAPNLLEATPPTDRPTSALEWLPYLTQNYAFNAKENFGNALGRTWKIFGVLPRQLPKGEFPVWCPLDDWIEEQTGLTIDEQLAFGFMLYAQLGIPEHGTPPKIHLPRDRVEASFEQLRFDERKRRAALNLISAPEAWFCEQLESSSSDPLMRAWNSLPFLMRPFLRLGNGDLLLTSPRAIQTWLTEGVYYRLLDAARAEQGARGVNDYTAYVGHLTERYAVELMEAAHHEPRVPSAGRVHREQFYGEEKARTTDIAVVFPHELFLFEISSGRLTVPSRIKGERKQVRKDLDKIVGEKVGRLATTIEAVKPERSHAARATLPDANPKRLARITPIIVSAAPLHHSPPMDDYLSEEMPETFNRRDVAGLELLDLEDLEAIAALVEKGKTVEQSFTEKRHRVGNQTDVARWLTADPTAPEVKRPTYLDQAFREIFERMGGLMGFDEEQVRERFNDATR
ncbi:MAG: hypothetical protein WBQ41_04545 [Solirubrobacterales bacterium]